MPGRGDSPSKERHCTVKAAQPRKQLLESSTQVQQPYLTNENKFAEELLLGVLCLRRYSGHAF